MLNAEEQQSSSVGVSLDSLTSRERSFCGHGEAAEIPSRSRARLAPRIASSGRARECSLHEATAPPLFAPALLAHLPGVRLEGHDPA